MSNTVLDLLADHYLETVTYTPEEKAYYHEALQYADKDHLDEAEGAVNCYAGVCEAKAFKQGFITAFRFLSEMK